MDSKQKTRVLVADHSQRFRAELRAVLEQQEDLQLAAEAEHHLHIAAILKAVPIDILVLDMELPPSGAMYSLRQVQRQSPETRVLLTGGPFSEDCITEALLLDVRGFVLRGCCPQDCAKAIGVIRAGDVWLGRKALLQVFTGLRLRLRGDGSRSWTALTPREREIAGAIARGLTNKEIARQLQISEKTIKAHLSHIFDKLGVSRRIQVVLLPDGP